jgi:hypothetical protein
MSLLRRALKWHYTDETVLYHHDRCYVDFHADPRLASINKLFSFEVAEDYVA